MKNALLHVNMALILLLSCGDSGKVASEEAKNCLPCADLVITNTSEYTIIELYAHASAEYFSDTSRILIAQDMESGESLNFPVDYGDSFYFTFIRKYFSTSSINIAVTTAMPVYIQDCYKYTLTLLEEDFYLEKENNYY